MINLLKKVEEGLLTLTYISLLLVLLSCVFGVFLLFGQDKIGTSLIGIYTIVILLLLSLLILLVFVFWPIITILRFFCCIRERKLAINESRHAIFGALLILVDIAVIALFAATQPANGSNSIIPMMVGLLLLLLAATYIMFEVHSYNSLSLFAEQTGFDVLTEDRPALLSFILPNVKAIVGKHGGRDFTISVVRRENRDVLKIKVFVETRRAADILYAGGTNEKMQSVFKKYEDILPDILSSYMNEGELIIYAKGDLDIEGLGKVLNFAVDVASIVEREKT
ncbi:MAG: hypothetical protein QXP42_05460 [Candidatus Micrarchaeia archaeon]